ncbi:DUF1893 domain-containing protein [Gudongella sp. DL1XJH-153]|uniref:DUF1893 domain-containing protein n=1 Tax=Gudongella sp. DL1XJH-153 TaxID=3409804 RepID=UPI003BB4FD0F
MEGIIKAKEYMELNSLKMVVYNNEKVVAQSTDRGIKPVYDVYTKEFDSLKGAFVADRITGKAAAMLLAEGKISGIYTDLISDPAVEIFQSKGVSIEYGQKVKHILNRDMDGMCPIETISRNVSSVDDLIDGIEAFFITVGMKK